MALFSVDLASAALLATFLAYLIGSIPAAALISKLRGVDIFSVGTGQAGATNVVRTVGALEGFVVMWVDIIKGMIAIGVAYRLGIHAEWILLPALGVIAGHWKSIFTHFRGGDGVSTLVGITVAILSIYGLVAVLAGLGLTLFVRQVRLPVPTLWGGITCYIILLARLPGSDQNPTIVIGLVLVSLLVLAHGVRGHRTRAV